MNRIKIVYLCLFLCGCNLFEDTEDLSVEVYNLNFDTMLKLSHNLDLNQFDFYPFASLIENNEFYNHEETLDTTGMYFISNSEIFGTDCYLFYDDIKKTLSGYIEATENIGLTGQYCSPQYLNELRASNGQKFPYTELVRPGNMDWEDFMNGWSIYTIPNPYIGSSAYNEDIYDSRLAYKNLPSFARINIFNGNKQKIRSLNHDTNSNVLIWNLRDSTNMEVPSGAYYYEISDAEQNLMRQGSTIILRYEEE